MPSFTSSDGLRLSYRDEGYGYPIVLLHGLTADGEMNWEWTGLGPSLRDAGFRTLEPDARGHGLSDKPHDPRAYREDRFAADVSELLDAVAVESCALVGYSMGAMTALRTVPDDPRVALAVFGGIGADELRARDREPVALALEADDPVGATDPEGVEMREFADATGADRRALAALMRGRHNLPFELHRVAVPALLLIGADDVAAGDPVVVAEAMAECELAIVAGDHASALIDPAFKAALLAFLTTNTPPTT